MSEKIILNYNNETKTINIPNNFSELQESFIKEFNEDKFKDFNFSYINEEKEVAFDISSENSFNQMLNDLNNNKNILINIKEKDSPNNKGIFQKNKIKKENNENNFKELYEKAKKNENDLKNKNKELINKNKNLQKQLDDKFVKIGGAYIEKVKKETKKNLENEYETKIKEIERKHFDELREIDLKNKENIEKYIGLQNILKNNLEEKNKEIKELKKQIENNNNIIKQKDEQLKQNEILIQNKKNEQIKDKEILELKKQIEAKNNIISQKDKIIENQNSKIELTIKENNEYKNLIEQYKKEIENSKLNQLNQLDQNKKNEEYQKIMKEEIEKGLKERYENELKKEMSKMNDILKEKINNNINKLKNQYNQDFEKKQNEFTQKLNEMREIKLKSNLEKKNNNLKPTCNTVHKGIKCKKCFQEPIIGYRYKCSVCNDYNLCEKCEEEKSEEHPHDFIKIRKEKNNNIEISINNFIDNSNIIPDANIINNNINNIQINNNDNSNIMQNNNSLDDKMEKEDNKINNDANNNINENANKEEVKYSYECTNILTLRDYVYEGTEEAKIDIILKNNGKETWPEGSTKLIFDEKEDYTGDNILLSPQKPGEEKKYLAIVKGIERNEPGEYKTFLYFNVNNENLGEKLTLSINIREQKSENDELNEKRDKIKEFRDNFGLDELDYSDEKLLEILKQYDFNFEKAFESLFN